MPIRVQRSRKKGWRMPENTVYVGRGSKWGNPFKIGPDGDAHQAVSKYSWMMMPYSHKEPHSSLENYYVSIANLEEAQRELAGKNLACWCPLGQPCHADILLTMANEGLTEWKPK